MYKYTQIKKMHEKYPRSGGGACVSRCQPLRPPLPAFATSAGRRLRRARPGSGQVGTTTALCASHETNARFRQASKRGSTNMEHKNKTRSKMLDSMFRSRGIEYDMICVTN